MHVISNILNVVDMMYIYGYNIYSVYVNRTYKCYIQLLVATDKYINLHLLFNLLVHV